MSDPDRPSELSVAARRVSASLIEGVHLRIDLFALELAEERRRVFSVVLATLALALALFMVFLCLNAALLVVFWDTQRVPIALGMCVFYVTASALLALVIARRTHRRERALSATRDVLEADRRALRGSP